MANNPPIDLPTDDLTNLSRYDIALLLEPFYQAPDPISKYVPYLYLANFFLDDFFGQVGAAIHYKDGDVGANTMIFRKSKNQPTPITDVLLFVHSISKLETDATKVFSGSDQDYQVFIALDRISFKGTASTILLPYQTAKLLSSSFVYGLATRLILDRYKKSWHDDSNVTLPFDLPLIAAGPIGSGPSPHPTPAPLNASDWCNGYLTALSAKLVDAGTWTKAASTYGTQSYSQLLANMTDASLQVVGIVMGWLAGDSLTDNTYGGSDALRKNFWAVLNSSYTTTEIGMMTGYTFSYLSGFLASERIKAMISGDPNPPPQQADPVKAPDAIYGKLNNNSVAKKLDTPTIQSDFLLFVLREFYAIASNAAAARRYQGFVAGFQRGLLLGADVMYQVLFFEAYQLGYTTGFQAGYVQGYAAGFSAGVNYNAGQQTWMAGLSSTLAGLSQVLANANAILSNPAVGTIIATLF